ncbi:MAG: hypothetical protein ABSG03_07920 [Bryobacteraceae bacterium]|jgi:hypothetical protein
MGTPVHALWNWAFEAEEVSAGVYKILGKSDHGLTVEFTGFDPDELIERAKAAAREMEGQLA